MDHSRDNSSATRPERSSAASPVPRRTLECPRCGHLLDGNADAAEARGETRGVCSECALPVEWAALRQGALAPKWFVEAQFSSYRLPRRLVGTLVRCLRPFHFWRSIDLAIPFSRRGAIAFIIGVAALLHVVAAGQRLTFVVPDCIDRFTWRTQGAASKAAADIVLAIIAPTARFDGATILHQTRLEVRSKSGSDVEVALRTAARFAMIAVYPMRSSMVFELNPTPWNPGGRTTVRGQALGPFWPEQGRSTIAASLATVLAPFAMLLLPTSLRRARIRPRHIVRISLYASALIVPIFAVAFLLPRVGAMYGEFDLGFVNVYGQPNADLILLSITTVFISIWMTAAARRYLRLPHAAGVGIACALIAVLAMKLLLHSARF